MTVDELNSQRMIKTLEDDTFQEKKNREARRCLMAALMYTLQAAATPFPGNIALIGKIAMCQAQAKIVAAQVDPELQKNLHYPFK